MITGTTFRFSSINGAKLIYFNLRGQREYVQASDLAEALIQTWPDDQLKIKILKPLSFCIQLSEKKELNYDAKIIRTDKFNQIRIYYIINGDINYNAKRIIDTKAPKIVFKFGNTNVFLFFPYSTIGNQLRSIFEYIQTTENVKYVVHRMTINKKNYKIPFILFMMKKKKDSILEVELRHFIWPIFLLSGPERRANFPIKA